MKRLGILIVALSLLVGLSMAVTICPLDPEDPQEFSIKSSTLETSLSALVLGTSDYSEHIQVEGTVNDTYLLAAANSQLSGQYGATGITKSTTVSASGLSAGIEQASIVEYYAPVTSMYFGENHLMFAATPKPLENETTAPYCEKVYGGSSGVFKAGSISSFTNALVAPYSTTAQYGVSTAQLTTPPISNGMLGSLNVFQSVSTKSGTNNNGTVTQDYSNQYDMSASFNGDVTVNYLSDYKSSLD